MTFSWMNEPKYLNCLTCSIGTPFSDTREEDPSKVIIFVFEELMVSPYRAAVSEMAASMEDAVRSSSQKKTSSSAKVKSLVVVSLVFSL